MIKQDSIGMKSKIILMVLFLSTTLFFVTFSYSQNNCIREISKNGIGFCSCQGTCLCETGEPIPVNDTYRMDRIGDCDIDEICKNFCEHLGGLLEVDGICWEESYDYVGEVHFYLLYNMRIFGEVAFELRSDGTAVVAACMYKGAPSDTCFLIGEGTWNRIFNYFHADCTVSDGEHQLDFSIDTVLITWGLLPLIDYISFSCFGIGIGIMMDNSGIIFDPGNISLLLLGWAQLIYSW